MNTDTTHSQGLVLPRDLTHHLSRSSRKRLANVLKEYYRFVRIPGMGSLAGGSPCPAYFPFSQLDISAMGPQSLFSIQQGLENCRSKDLALSIRRSHDEPDPFKKIDLDTALQYGVAQGYPPLYSWLKTLVNSVYHPDIPYQGGADVVICGGAADGLSKVYDILFNEWDQSVNSVKDREGLLVEEMVYAPPITQTKHKDINIVPVRMDVEGMMTDGPGGLLDVLENWNCDNGKRPHVVYLIPTGQNPTSGVLSLPRRRRIYEICSAFDIVIIEDDPYWHLFYPAKPACDKSPHATIVSAADSDCSGPSPKAVSTGYAFLDQLVPSFLHLDVDGRVIRLDTFSKTIGPGCRLGWITAQPSICEQLIRVTDATTQQPSGFVQAIVIQLLARFDAKTRGTQDPSQAIPDPTSSWGVEGWIDWLEGLRDKYQRRMLTMSSIFHENRHLNTDSGQVEMFSFHRPMGGMFVWLKVHLDHHPLHSAMQPERLMQALWILCTQKPYRIIMNPGKDFAANDDIRRERGFSYLRFCFAAVEESHLVTKSHSFIQACRDFWHVYTVDGVNEILREEDARSLALGLDIGEEDEIDRLIIGHEAPSSAPTCHHDRLAANGG